MIKVAIVTNKLVSGGIEKELITLLNNLDKEKYEITLFLIEENGQWEYKVPVFIKKIYIYKKRRSIKEKLKYYIKNKKFYMIPKVMLYSLLSRSTSNIADSFYYMSKTFSRDKELYDVAVSFCYLFDMPIMYSLFNIRAIKRILWLHNDCYKIKDSYINFYKKYYKKFDNIVAVSQGIKRNFESKVGIQNVEVIGNFIDVNEIRNLAIIYNPYKKMNNEVFILATVGRLSKEKGQDLIPIVAHKIKKDGFVFKWYIVGEGQLRDEIEKNIKQNNVEDNVVLVGNKDNPYPYINYCDIYVQPSLEESYGITLAEAKYLFKPILCFDTIGACEQLKNNVNSIIVTLNDIHYIDKFVDSLENLMRNDNLRSELICNLSIVDGKENNKLKSIEKILSI